TVQITVTVNNPYYPLYTQVNPQNSGSITKYPNKQLYLKGEQVQLYATPTQGYKFLNWSGDVQSSSNPVLIIIDSTKTIIANFELISSTTPQDDILPKIWVNLINGQIISGEVELKIVIEDDFGVTSVKMYKNNNLVIDLSTSTLKSQISYIWDTTLDPNGIYEVKIQATDTKNQLSIETLALVINNVSGNEPPIVTLQNILPNTTITSSFEITPNIETDDNIIKVEYYLNESLVYTSTSSPFSFIINPINFSTGSYNLVVLAYDTANQVGTFSVNINLSYSQIEYKLERRYFLSLNEDNKNEVIEFKVDKEIEDVKIYDIKGKLVKEIKENFIWDGKNDQGKKLKPGFYIYKCKFKDGTTKTGNIILVK
ncbi:MAG: Ig-like domain-containing protein, partial [Endomicrobia bacterium]|nr:Ig-like domain-containing protein [Endomicrobiia bacterium]